MSEAAPTGYHYGASAEASHTANYLWEPILGELKAMPWSSGEKNVFELGCGNGAFAETLTNAGYAVTGVDPSEEGIAIARRTRPSINLNEGSAYEDLASRFGRFQALISLEVVEHVFYPRKYAKCVRDLLEPNGLAFISTPYHGYLKNLALTLCGKWDFHHSPLWDYGHIKFWSRKTLGELFAEAGLRVERFHRVGRIPALAKSMIAVVRRID